MKKLQYTALLSFVLFITCSSFVFANFSSDEVRKAEDQRIALICLESFLNDTGKKLQMDMDLHVHNMDIAYGIYDEVPLPELNAIVLSRYISEKFSCYRTYLRLFINSYQEGYNDHSNKKLLYHLLTFVTPAKEIQHFKDILFSKYNEIENKKVLEELDKAEETISLIIEEINNYESILNKSFIQD